MRITVELAGYEWEINYDSRDETVMIDRASSPGPVGSSGLRTVAVGVWTEEQTIAVRQWRKVRGAPLRAHTALPFLESSLKTALVTS